MGEEERREAVKWTGAVGSLFCCVSFGFVCFLCVGVWFFAPDGMSGACEVSAHALPESGANVGCVCCGVQAFDEQNSHLALTTNPPSLPSPVAGRPPARHTQRPAPPPPPYPPHGTPQRRPASPEVATYPDEACPAARPSRSACLRLRRTRHTRRDSTLHSREDAPLRHAL